jgi:acetyl-CoA carboxylase biotin carboxylase subunit/3-methylcrotonyl-CoA carboxylase alpha subunit
LFRKILVANRGEIACRIIRTCRRLGISTVAVHSDADAHALHVELADEAVRIGPPPVRDSYLDARVIVEAARSTGAEAIHPGYGLLSEKGMFARAVQAAGLTFIGPPAEVLDAVGDKMKARKVAMDAGVGPVPGLSEPLPVDSDGAVGAPAMENARSAAEKIGYPLMVKAVGGGGGIGMQIVDAPASLERALKSCSDRGRAAFGDGRVYIERYVRRPRHIEVQIFCDQAGAAVSLGERECSAQRRHQKIIEESPSPASFFAEQPGGGMRGALEDAALKIARRAGYVGAGTCEFIFDETGAFFFLEVNARLQVEHPVTEMCTSLDLVEWQLRVAAGEPLGAPLKGAARRGHAIEARIYAEDPAKSFAPQPGRLTRLSWPAAASDLRIETGVREGDEVSPYYDPLLAKIVAHGADRASAIARLDQALASTVVELTGPRGAAATNVTYLRRILTSTEFASGAYDTGLVDELRRIDAAGRSAAGPAT